MHEANTDFRHLLELSDLIKTSSPDSHEVIDMTVNNIREKLLSINQRRRDKTEELDRLKSQW